jgi:hypothetical protein
MAKPLQHSLSDVMRPVSHVPLYAAGGLLLACLIGGLIYAVIAGQTVAAAIFTLSLLGLGAISFTYVAQLRKAAAAEKSEMPDWQMAKPEIQRQNLNVEVTELARILNTEEENLPDLLSAYIVAEDLALRHIQQEEDLPLMRHVQLGKTPFDAVLFRHDLVICAEVAFVVEPDLRQVRIDAMLRKVGSLKKTLAEMGSHLDVRLLIILVTQLTPDDNEKLRTALSSNRFENTPADIDIRMLDFEELQRIYVTE